MASSAAGAIGCSNSHVDGMGQGVPEAGAGGSTTVAGGMSTAGGGGVAGSTLGGGAAPSPTPTSPTPTTPATPTPVPPAAGAPAPTPPTSPTSPETMFAPLPGCTGSPRFLANLASVYEPDFAARYNIYGGFNDPFVGPSIPSASQIEAVGQACSTAGDVMACLGSVGVAEQPPAGCVNGTEPCEPFLITTEGDEVRRYAGPQEILDFLGDIDTPHEAALLLVFAGYNIGCPVLDLVGTQTRRVEGGYEVLTEWDECSGDLTRQVFFVSEDGDYELISSEILGTSNCVVGRRPEALASALPERVGSDLGAFFANAAHLEAASVFSFERLARELLHHGAPEALVGAAAVSALDEIRHARDVALLARRFGGEPSVPRVARGEVRPLCDIALENAVEGCVRETYGALLATYQAATALDPEVQRVLVGIAEDETRHATLSWQIAAWIEPQLDDRAREALALAKRAAAAELYGQLDQGLSPADAAHIGWPTADKAAELLGGLLAAIA